MTAQLPENTIQRRQTFRETHQTLIETAVRLISEKGVEALSVAALAREADINRTTVYYHFANRDELLEAVKIWSSQQLAKAFELDAPQHQRIDYLTRFVLDNPQLIKLWIQDFISPGDVRHSYPHWDAFVEGTKAHLARGGAEEEIDAELFCINLLTFAIIGPRVFKNSVHPQADNETVIRRFRRENERLLRHSGLLESETFLSR